MIMLITPLQLKLDLKCNVQYQISSKVKRRGVGGFENM